MSFLSTAYFLSVMPLVLSAGVCMLAMFAHLSFKTIRIQTVQYICAVLGGVFGWLYFVNMYVLNAKHGFYVYDIYYLFLFFLALFAMIWGAVRGTVRIGIFQMIGIPVFLYGSYLLLA